MKVSIVTTVLNGYSSIQKCLDSVVNQTYPCEHIVVDGGSTDGTMEILRKSTNPHLRLYVESGAGIAQGFNVGFLKSSGDIIGVLNADDWYELDAVERTVKVLDSRQDADFSYGTVVVHNRRYNILAHPLEYSRFKEKCVLQMPFWHISAFIKKDLFRKYGPFDESFKVAMDNEFFADVISSGAVGAEVPGVLAHALDGGVTSNVFRAFKAFYKTSAKHIGPTRAFYHHLCLAMRNLVFRGIASTPLVRRILTNRSGKRFEVIAENERRNL